MQYSAPADGFRIAYERSGSGSAVVLLHGWPGDHTDWDHLVDRLAGAADLLRPDLRGFGQSDKHEADLKRSTRVAGKLGPSPHSWTNSG